MDWNVISIATKEFLRDFVEVFRSFVRTELGKRREDLPAVYVRSLVCYSVRCECHWETRAPGTFGFIFFPNDKIKPLGQNNTNKTFAVRLDRRLCGIKREKRVLQGIAVGRGGGSIRGSFRRDVPANGVCLVRSMTHISMHWTSETGSTPALPALNHNRVHWWHTDVGSTKLSRTSLWTRISSELDNLLTQFVSSLTLYAPP